MTIKNQDKRIKMFGRVSSYMRIILIKEEKQRIIKKINDTKIHSSNNICAKDKVNELNNYLHYLNEQLKIYPDLK